jgi:hypothetical protein
MNTIYPLNIHDSKTSHSIGQGSIFYNGTNYFSNLITATMDMGQVVGDLGSLLASSHVFHKPFLGLHGTFLLVNGQVEKTCTWEWERFVDS